MKNPILAENANRNSNDGLRRRKALGAFYTPDLLSQVLSDWGIRKSTDFIVEPSFGGCTFLESISQRLESFNCSGVINSVVGCDIDLAAFEKLSSTKGLVYNKSNFYLRDFLQLNPDEVLAEKADLVIGNPPYIRHSYFSEEQKKSIEAWKVKYKLDVDARSSLWVHFLLHGLNFLRRNGRLALVLPGSFLSADYSKKIQEILRLRFTKTLVISLSERIFLEEGAEERSVILLCEGFENDKSKPGKMDVVNCSYLKDIEGCIQRWPEGNLSARNFEGVGATSCVDSGAIEDFLQFSNVAPIKKLRELAAVNIGIVTGDTKYFIRTASDWARYGIPKESLKFIVPKIKDIAGINLTSAQCQHLIDGDVRCLLLDTSKEDLPYTVVRYLELYDKARLDKVATFRKRDLWHQPDDFKQPHGFLSFLTHNGPRLIVNSVRVNSTNSVHRVFLNEFGIGVGAKLIAVSLLTTYTQLHAEIIGRICGSGALKLEPKDALKLQVIIPDQYDRSKLLSLFGWINRQMKSDSYDENEVRKAADSFIEQSLGVDGAIARFGHALHEARASRRGE